MEAQRKPLIAGNWKMNAGAADGCALARAVARAVKKLEHVEVLVAPPFTAVAAVAYELHEASEDTVAVAAQNMHFEANGAFTGEVSAAMLKDAGASWVIVGHSERRQLFAEDDETVAKKARAAIAAELRPICCVGETLAEREAQQTLEVVGRQVRALVEVLAQKPGYGVIAYEPVWAIGTGRVAAPSDAQAVHAAIRAILRETSNGLANKTRILYGGSVKADNAEGLLSERDIDGALVGGAALDAAGFANIAATAQRLHRAIKAGTLPTPVSDVLDENEMGKAADAPAAEPDVAAAGGAEAPLADEGPSAESERADAAAHQSFTDEGGPAPTPSQESADTAASEGSTGDDAEAPADAETGEDSSAGEGPDAPDVAAETDDPAASNDSAVAAAADATDTAVEGEAAPVAPSAAEAEAPAAAVPAKGKRRRRG